MLSVVAPLSSDGENEEEGGLQGFDSPLARKTGRVRVVSETPEVAVSTKNRRPVPRSSSRIWRNRT